MSAQQADGKSMHSKMCFAARVGRVIAHECRRTTEEERVEVKLSREMAEKLPLLQDILSSSSNLNDGNSVYEHSDRERDTRCAKTDDRNQQEVQQTGRKEIALRLPGSVWALVSLVLVLEQRVILWQWLGDIQADPSLAQQTLEVQLPLLCSVLLLAVPSCKSSQGTLKV
jgi:predicted ATP-binding protein involved in virulence